MLDTASFSPLPAIRPLVVSTEPYFGEPLSSVLVRSCEANVFSKPLYLLSLIGVKAQAPEFIAFTHNELAPNIAKLIGMPVEAIKNIMHPPVEDPFDRPCVEWFGSPIERRHIDASVRRFAPRSLEEGQHHKAIWMVRLLDYCPLSMELLVAECPQCSQPLGWRACRSVSNCDKCGTSLMGAKSRTVPPHLHDAAQLGGALLSPKAAHREAALSTLPEPFSTWSPADALLALLTLGKAQISLKDSNAVKTVGSAQFIAAGAAFVKDWPESLTRFAKSSTLNHKSPSVKMGLGSLGHLTNIKAIKSPIRDLILSNISTSFGEAAIPAKLQSRLIDATCRKGKLTALEASKKLPIRDSHLRRLEGRSDTFLVRHQVKGGIALYDESAIHKLQEALAISQTPNDCARQLGVPIHCIDAFISEDLINIIKNYDAMIVKGCTLISKKSISCLKERLLIRSTCLDGAVTLREAMRRNANPSHWVDIFKCILDSFIRFRFEDRPNFSFSDNIFVNAADVINQISRRSTDKNVRTIIISCQKASEILRIKPGIFASFVQHDLISGTLGKKNIQKFALNPY